MKLLSQGNTKTGKGISIFNLPRKKTCPCFSDVCDQVCYATWFNRFANIKTKYERNLKASKAPDFIKKMCNEISGKKLIRFHASGDFYSKEYAHKWVEICKLNPDTVFFGYTRCWDDTNIMPELDILGKLPNVQLWWSSDSSMPEPPDGYRAYLSLNDNDIPTYKVDLIFRNNRDTVQKTLGGYPVCPHEDGRFSIKDNPLKCETCKKCFKSVI